MLILNVYLLRRVGWPDETQVLGYCFFVGKQPYLTRLGDKFE